MVSLIRSKAVLELGRRLVSQLDADDDLLVSWMAHFIAELIESVEKAPAETKTAAQETCSRAILELWRYRAALPHRLRPFAELEPVLLVLASLDAEGPDYRYYPASLREVEAADADDETKRLLKFAIEADFVARFLIQTALRSAARRAASAAESWVELAARAGAEEGVEKHVVEFVLGDEDGDEMNEDARDSLKTTLSRLEWFANFATLLSKGIRAQLEPSDVNKE